MGRISTSPRYMTDMTGSALFGGVGGGGSNSENYKGICNFRTGDQILMKFDI